MTRFGNRHPTSRSRRNVACQAEAVKERRRAGNNLKDRLQQQKDAEKTKRYTVIQKYIFAFGDTTAL
jgi:hypothetical protein